MKSRMLQLVVVAAGLSAGLPLAATMTRAPASSFNIVEAEIADIHDAYKAGTLTSRQVVQTYLDRIEAYDRKGPQINSVISVNPKALEDADRLDAAFIATGKFVGPLHGIPVLIKDQVDVAGIPTTLGSLVMKDYVPQRDAGAVSKVKRAGGIVLAKVTLGEMGGGDTYGSLFGVTRNPYDIERTAGGSSGGSAAGISANLGAIAIGQEGFASIRRPSTWNSTVGMRPSPGLVTRSGAWGGWPSPVGQLGPMARTVTDMARLLDVMVGYDPEDPLTALGAPHIPATSTLIKDGINPPYVNEKGAPHLNTFLIHAASMAVPAGFTSDGLPAGITFFGPPYSEPTLFRLAYAYEQATHHRIPPGTTPPLVSEGH